VQVLVVIAPTLVLVLSMVPFMFATLSTQAKHHIGSILHIRIVKRPSHVWHTLFLRCNEER